MSIEKAYDRWSEQYDLNENKTRDLDQKATQAILSNYDFYTVLELGCGTGKNTVWLLGKAKSVMGIDFSQKMLDIAKGRITDKRASFIKADLHKDWAVENQSLDLITSSLTLEHIENLGHIFYQASRKLQNNGLFFISELHPFKQYLGSKAKFETSKGVEELEVYTHNITDYTIHAEKHGFNLLELKEWFDDPGDKKIPRLITFVFRKNG